MDPFRDAVRDLQRAINQDGGLDKVALSDETLRPLALKLCAKGKSSGHMLAAFDFSKGDEKPDKIYLGFVVPLMEATSLANEVAVEAKRQGWADILKSAKGRITPMEHTAAIWFENLYIPSAALRAH